MTPQEMAIFFVAGILSGGVNAVAGGGSLVSFPILLASGIPSVSSSATNTAAQVAGGISGAWGLRDRLKGQGKRIGELMLVTVLGAVAGALLLSQTKDEDFSNLVPILIFLGVLVLALKPVIAARFQRVKQGLVWAILLQLAISIYGGYFGAGMGILMLAVLGLVSTGDTHDDNALKNVLGLGINFSAAVFLAFKGAISWGPAIAVSVGSLLGAYGTARASLRMNPELLRWLVVSYGVIMGGYFAYRTWF
ncbi:MAG: sulfite exporter TauE/SafE family protein [Fimbriimonadaceae bacterium]|nr:sulfite exporter TauE/SafE family protein [Fimbriimonadaceae bacterium]